MYTQCSSCATLFRVTPRHLRQARGTVRCCLCQEAFDALATLTDRLPAELAERAGVEAAAVRATAAEALRADVEPFDELAAAGLAEDEEVAEPPRRLGAAGLSLIALAALAAVVLQYAYVMRGELARYPQLRPWIEGLCQVAACELPLLRDVARVHILDKHVAVDPAVPGGLLVRAVLVNETGFAQPFPQARFIFLDPGGAEQASRWFSPDEYLGHDQAGVRVPDGMPPKEPVLIRLAVSDVAPAALDNFEIEFR